jgi:hypothetical protein
LSLSPAQKAWQTRRGRSRREEGFKVEREAKTFTKKMLREKGDYRSVSFESVSGHEGTGVVDVVAVPRNKTNRNYIDIILLQLKGGEARLKEGGLRNLREAGRHLNVSYSVATKRGRSVRFDPNPFNENIE